jgi:hypothetical protein
MYTSRLERKEGPPIWNWAVHQLQSHGWFAQNNVPLDLVVCAVKSTGEVWRTCGECRESQNITLQELYNAFRIDPTQFTVPEKMAIFLNHPSISSVLLKRNDNLPMQIVEMEDDIDARKEAGLDYKLIQDKFESLIKKI